MLDHGLTVFRASQSSTASMEYSTTLPALVKAGPCRGVAALQFARVRTEMRPLYLSDSSSGVRKTGGLLSFAGWCFNSPH